jgi:hypothetical protein
VSATADLSFDALAAGTERSSLAYWIGPCDVAALRGLNAIGITRAMSYQYDVEEQADRTGVVVPEDTDWRTAFTPVAPVQLARAWSPLPLAVDLLGPPDWASAERDMGARAAACAWRPANAGELGARREHSPDYDRFHRLLIVTLMRARDSNHGLLIAAKPGWSYGHAHTPSADTRRLMEAVGFVVHDRHA